MNASRHQSHAASGPRAVRGVAALAVVAVMAWSGVAIAAGGTGQYTLPWSGNAQVLEYRSCGCADACWTAQVRSTKTRAVLATLRCDCEHLHVSLGKRGKEQDDPRSCAALDDKPVFIRETLEQLLKEQTPSSRPAASGANTGARGTKALP